MSQVATAPAPPPRDKLPAPASSPPWLAAVAIIPILATVYQTLVLTDVTDDLIRLGIGAEHYGMIWTNVSWGVAIIYGVFAGIWAMARYGAGTPCWSDSPGLRWEIRSAGRRPISERSSWRSLWRAWAKGW